MAVDTHRADVRGSGVSTLGTSIINRNDALGRWGAAEYVERLAKGEGEAITQSSRHYSNLDPVRQPARGGLGAKPLRRVCEYLESHLGEDNRELAAIADLSPAQFGRAFKTSTGASRWRNERRIAHSKEMLADPRIPITEIALICGFSDHSHFGKVFREHIGVAPGVWRRERGA